jgi:VanZ family protein
MLTLRYKNLWIIASVVLVATVIWGSVQTAFGGPSVRGFDKVQHFGTYLFLAVWFTGLLSRPRYWIAALGLLGLGLAMEIAQLAMQAGRMGDPYDMAANTAGVITGVLLALYVTGGWAQRVESWLR